MILRAAGPAVHEILYTANGDNRDDEEKRDETHAFLLREIPDSTAVAAAHLRRRRLRAPREEVGADDEKECNHGVGPTS